MDVAAIDKYDDALTAWREVEADCVRRIADAKQAAIDAQQTAVKSLPSTKLTVVRAVSGTYYVAENNSLRKAEDVIVSAEDEGGAEP